jgi:hypothetical protein
MKPDLLKVIRACGPRLRIMSKVRSLMVLSNVFESP